MNRKCKACPTFEAGRFRRPVLGFDRGAKRTIASLRRAYTMSTETTFAPSAFYDRFTPALAELMRELTVHALTRTPTCVQIVPGSTHDLSLLSA